MPYPPRARSGIFGDIHGLITSALLNDPEGSRRSYNQNLWMHHLTEGATYLPL